MPPLHVGQKQAMASARNDATTIASFVSTPRRVLGTLAASWPITRGLCRPFGRACTGAELLTGVSRWLRIDGSQDPAGCSMPSLARISITSPRIGLTPPRLTSAIRRHNSSPGGDPARQDADRQCHTMVWYSPFASSIRRPLAGQGKHATKRSEHKTAAAPHWDVPCRRGCVIARHPGDSVADGYRAGGSFVTGFDPPGEVRSTHLECTKSSDSPPARLNRSSRFGPAGCNPVWQGTS